MSEEKTKQDEIKPNELTELQAQCQEYLNGWRRAQADYQNLKKETEKDRVDFVKYASMGLLMEILPVYDHLKLALKHVQPAEQDKHWVSGVWHIQKQFKKVLADNGVTEIKTVGEKFNPEEHEAVENEKETEKLSPPNFLEDYPNKDQANRQVGENKEAKEDDDEIIKREVKAGYKLHGKVLYPARVIV